MGNLDVRVTADVVDLQTKMSVAKAEVQAYGAELRKLAQQSAEGILDPAGQAKLQQAAEDFLKAQQEVKGLSAEMKELRETGGNVGETLEEIRGKLSAAFEFTGIAAGVEAIRSLGEAIEQIGARAVQMKSSSDVLGVTVEQFQAMEIAAEEAGVSTETFTRAGERFVSVLTQARDGSSAAIEKLLSLGATAEQIQSPTFQLNDLFQVLHDRLTDTSTKQDTMNQLIKDLGARAGLAAEALVKYDGSAEAVAEVMSKISGLSTQQVGQLAETKAKLGEVTATIENYTAKVLLAAQALGQWIEKHNASAQALAQRLGASEGNESTAPNVGVIDRSAQQAAEAAAQQQKELQHEIQQEELENIKAGIQAYKDGSAQKLAQLREYAAAAQQYYGSSEVDAVKKANEQVIAETRRVQEAQLQAGAQYNAQLQKEGQDKLNLVQKELALDEEYLNERKKQLDTIDSMQQFGLELETSITKQRDQLRKEETKINQQAASEYERAWKPVIDRVSSEFSSNISKWLTGHQTFAQSMRSIFQNMTTGIIDNLAKIGVQMVLNAALGKASGVGAAKTNILANAAQAASGAMASAAAIPYIGWILAPIEGAAVYAAALAYGSGLTSAAGGYDIPGGSNPIVQTHAREMILPAPLAEGIRNMIGTQQAAAPSRTSIVNIHGGKGASFTSDQLASMLKELGHRFVFR